MPKSFHETGIETLLVGWDSEYDTSDGFIPISTQFYVHNDEKSYFLEHIGEKKKLSELVQYLHQKYPTHNQIKLVCHFSISEMQGIADGRELALEHLFAIRKNLIGKLQVKLGDSYIAVTIIDTSLLLPIPLEQIANLMGIKKLDTEGYRESGKMLEWFEKDPHKFKQYSLRDAEIAVKFYVECIVKFKEYGLRESFTIGGVYERTLFTQLVKGNYMGLGYSKRKLFEKGKFKGYKLVTQGSLEDFIYSYYIDAVQ